MKSDWKLPINHETGKYLRCPKCHYTLVLRNHPQTHLPFYDCPHCDYTCPSNRSDRNEYLASLQGVKE